MYTSPWRNPKTELRNKSRNNSGEIASLQQVAAESGSLADDPHPVLPALREVLLSLTVLRSITVTIVLALRSQSADYDGEVAEVLKRCVSDELDRMIARLNRIFQREP
jgi:hypothetical protein